MKFKKTKLGELTTQQIVVITILMASFAVILFLLFRLNLGNQTNAEICHNSVILKGKGSSWIGGGSLNCKTNYVCIAGEGKCNEINTETIQINKNDNVDDKYEIKKAIADKMAECWWMFGEGKVDYVGAEALPTTSCAVCSSISFGGNMGVTLNYKELFEFLETNKFDNSQTYLHYLFNVGSTSEFLSKNGNEYTKERLEENFDFQKKYSIITGYGGHLPFSDGNSYPVYFMKTEDVSQYSSCKAFITKA